MELVRYEPGRPGGRKCSSEVSTAENTVTFSRQDKGDGTFQVKGVSKEHPNGVPVKIGVKGGQHRTSFLAPKSVAENKVQMMNLRELVFSGDLSITNNTISLSVMPKLLGGGAHCSKISASGAFSRRIEAFCKQLKNSNTPVEQQRIMEEVLEYMEDPNNAEARDYTGFGSTHVDFTCNSYTAGPVLLELFIYKKAPIEMFRRLVAHHDPEALLFFKGVDGSRSPVALCCLGNDRLKYLKVLVEERSFWDIPVNINELLKNGKQTFNHQDGFLGHGEVSINLVDLATAHGLNDVLLYLAEEAIRLKNLGDTALFDQFSETVQTLTAKHDAVFQTIIDTINGDSPHSVVQLFNKYTPFFIADPCFALLLFQTPAGLGVLKTEEALESAQKFYFNSIRYVAAKAQSSNSIIATLTRLGFSSNENQASREDSASARGLRGRSGQVVPIEALKNKIEIADDLLERLQLASGKTS